MAATNEDEYGGNDRPRSSFFRRSLSPRSFEKLRDEDSDYFYKPKRGPSRSKSNITITRPIKKFETVTKLVELLSKGNNNKNNNNNNIKTKHDADVESTTLLKKLDEQKSPSHYSSLLSMDGGNLSSNNPSNFSSNFSSRSSSSILTVAEQESPFVVIEKPICKSAQTSKYK
jgi:hypothetical protein